PLPAVDSYSVEGEAQATQIKALHEQVRDQITKHNLQYQAHANKHRKHVVFNEGDLVWIYLHKDRFPPGRYGKLQDRTSRLLEGEDDTDVPDGSSPVDQRAIDENEAGGLSG
nr:RNA-directed DNA polymerase [Tanacetum cinerariifolium]